MGMAERRHAVDIQVDEKTSALFTAGWISNIGSGGLFIESPHPLPISSRVDLTLGLPELRTVLKVQGRVAWTYDILKGTTQLITGSGIKFVDMSPEQRDLLERYLARVTPNASAR